ncbi:hypothetical protein SAMN02745126_04322 [Enhydrobacter aerosaccus]|uniref:Uncharacterized protein n=1 Tax=Enhydrobacter aerosaccus TaxID=225324 RepID=A0A1T4S353_9HYPH|nr:hypothetical protein SAMN02745126_04322 [Enhydrobacter aerosaccus]
MTSSRARAMKAGWTLRRLRRNTRLSTAACQSGRPFRWSWPLPTAATATLPIS